MARAPDVERRAMAQVEERTGEAFEFAEQLTVVGRKLQPGDPAPDFTLERLDAGTGAMRQVRLADTSGTVRLLNVINSLDTPVCHVETRRWDELRANLPDAVTLYTISMDLPFAQARSLWRTSWTGVRSPRSGRGRPRLRPRRLAGDKGYSSPTARRRLRQRRISPVIPSKSNQRRQPHFDRAAYRLRNRVERLINRLKQFRRIATRYEKRAANYLAMLTIGMILLWI